IVRFKKIRPRRGSLAVSIIWGSPIAASSRSAALAYFMGSPRHDSRYSAIDMSVSLRASKDRAKALNRESLYMIPLLIGLLQRWNARLISYVVKAPLVYPARESNLHIQPLDTRPTPTGNAILVLDDPPLPKTHMISTICNHRA